MSIKKIIKCQKCKHYESIRLKEIYQCKKCNNKNGKIMAEIKIYWLK